MATDYSKSSNFHKIVIKRLSSDASIRFKSFLTDFSDNYSANWDLQQIYGRTDPIYTYKNTVRKITIAFDVPSFDQAEALQNYTSLVFLKEKMLYPDKQEMSNQSLGASLIVAPPLVRMSVLNFAYTNIGGVLGWIDSYTYKFDLEQGYYTDGNVLYPKLSKVNFNFNVIHEKNLGRDKPASKS